MSAIEASAGTAEWALWEAIDRLLDDCGPKEGPGLALGIYQSGRRAYLRGFGCADLEQRAVITPRTVFHVASVSKHLTAFAVALLARDGKVDLQANVASICRSCRTLVMR